MNLVVEDPAWWVDGATLSRFGRLLALTLSQFRYRLKWEKLESPPEIFHTQHLQKLL